MRQVSAAYGSQKSWEQTFNGIDSLGAFAIRSKKQKLIDLSDIRTAPRKRPTKSIYRNLPSRYVLNSLDKPEIGPVFVLVSTGSDLAVACSIFSHERSVLNRTELKFGLQKNVILRLSNDGLITRVFFAFRWKFLELHFSVNAGLPVLKVTLYAAWRKLVTLTGLQKVRGGTEGFKKETDIHITLGG